MPGSGKTWIAQQLEKKFFWLPHDEFPTARYGRELVAAAGMASRPVLAEAPFRMSVLWKELEDAGLTVHAYFIREPEELIALRYLEREGKPIPKQHLSNYRRLLADDRPWIVGSQQEILERLRNF